MSSKNKNNESPTIERVFELLDKWRHLPAYKLEPRADIFFALFLPEVLENHFKHLDLEIEINPMIIPEFPIRLAGLEDILERHRPPRKRPLGFQSSRADYFAYSSKGAHSFIIELKTDMSSIGELQMELLVEAAKRRELERLVCDVIDISKSKNVDRQKYFHLLYSLQELGLVNGVEEVCYKEYPRVNFHVVVEGLKKVNVTNAAKGCPKPKVVYIIPEGPRDAKNEGSMHGIHQIPFEEFIKYAKNRGAIGSRFAKSLECWKKQAGSCPPQL